MKVENYLFLITKEADNCYAETEWAEKDKTMAFSGLTGAAFLGELENDDKNISKSAFYSSLVSSPWH